MYPLLAKSNIMILLNEKTTQPCAVVLDGISFLKSHWQFHSVSLKMINCNAATLALKTEHVRNVTVQNSIFGNWIFDHVEHVSLKNCSGSIVKGFSTLLGFYRASGFLANITIKDLVFTNHFEGLWVQNSSYVKINKSNLVNNTVTLGIIKVLDSSILEMSDCTLRKNNAKNIAGAIYVRNSTVHLKQTNFSDNKAAYRGGALYLQYSFLHMKNCIFSNNQVKFGYPITNESDDRSGGAIRLFNSTFKGININFTQNTACYGGAVRFGFLSKVIMQYTNFSNNIALTGSAIYRSTFSKFLCKNCSMYQNQNVGTKMYTNNVIALHYNSLMNVSGFKCENNRGTNVNRGLTCIIASNNCTVLIYSAIFSMNFGSTILLLDNSHLVVVSSSFFNNTVLAEGGAIYSANSTLDVSYSIFYHNRAKQGGSLYMVFSTAVLYNCTFKNNSITAVLLHKNTVASIFKCSFESNWSPLSIGALLIDNFSFVNVSRTTFLNNSGTTGGAVLLIRNSLLVISSCYFSSNTALYSTDQTGAGGGIFIQGSTLEMFATRFLQQLC